MHCFPCPIARQYSHPRHSTAPGSIFLRFSISAKQHLPNQQTPSAPLPIPQGIRLSRRPAPQCKNLSKTVSRSASPPVAHDKKPCGYQYPRKDIQGSPVFFRIKTSLAKTGKEVLYCPCGLFGVFNQVPPPRRCSYHRRGFFISCFQSFS